MALALKTDVLASAPIDSGATILPPADAEDAHTSIDNPELEFCKKPFSYSDTLHIMLL